MPPGLENAQPPAGLLELPFRRSSRLADVLHRFVSSSKDAGRLAGGSRSQSRWVPDAEPEGYALTKSMHTRKQKQICD